MGRRAYHSRALIVDVAVEGSCALARRKTRGKEMVCRAAYLQYARDSRDSVYFRL